ncbi:MAG: hypothetical protein WCV00_19900 [Verrucomicrobiia bacterium]|jgi:hypothetical protein
MTGNAFTDVPLMEGLKCVAQLADLELAADERALRLQSKAVSQ